jgi:hypothetical protein
MEDVFASAYYTVTTTSAEDSEAGFLERKRKTNNKSIYVEIEPGQRVAICAGMANFDMEVGEAGLNKRGWVMQERLLSRRIIHFGESQAY